MPVGLRVVRGPDWKHGNQDGGPNHVGTVTEIADNNQVKVQWDMGQTMVCRTGQIGQHDLKTFDSAPLGIHHQGILCDGCGEDNICGMRWKCAVCDDFDLCTPCYYDDCHLVTHPFFLIENPGDTPVKLAKRLASQRERAMGTFPEATVIQGPDLDHDLGYAIVEDLVSYDRSVADTNRDAVKVTVKGGSTQVFRLGFQGKVDVICKEKTSGPSYYPDHIPVVDSTKSKPTRTKLFGSTGDTELICVVMSVLEFKSLQQTKCRWDPIMEELVYHTVKVEALTEDGDYVVDYNDSSITIHKDAATAVPKHAIGDAVKVTENVKLLKMLQRRHGGWLDEIEKVIGLTGRVTAIDEDGDVGVSFPKADFVFHPLALIPLYTAYELECGTEEVEEEDSKSTKPNGSKQTNRRDVDDICHMLEGFAGLMMLEALVRSQATDVKIRYLKAVINGRADEVGLLLKRFPNLKDTRHEGLPCLCYAAHEGHFGVVKAMIDEGSDIDLPDDRGSTSLMIMIIKNNLRSANFLIDNGAAVNKTNKDKQTVLHIAVRLGKEDAVRLLLNKKCDPNLQDNFGDTPLHDAIDKQKDSIAKRLIQLPSLNVWVKNKAGFNTLIKACREPDILVVEALVERTPSLVNSSEGRTNSGSYPLHVAAINDHVAVMKILVEKGKANLDCRNDNMATPLQLAAMKAHLDAVKLLVNFRADCNVKDKNGNTPFHFCLLGRRDESLVLTLMGLGRNVELSERKAIAKLLIDNGANADEKNHNGRSAIDACTNIGLRLEVRRLILEKEVRHIPLSRPTFARTSIPSVQPKSNVSPKASTTVVTKISSSPMASTMTDKSTENIWCMRCSENRIDSIFRPCRHKIACLKCCKQYKKCPICRQTISNVTDKYGDPVKGNTCSLS